jgi:SnoaL-like domain/Pentapeptide repeats (8 copies)
MEVLQIHEAEKQLDAHDFNMDNSKFVMGSLRNSIFEDISLESVTFSDINGSKIKISNADLSQSTIRDTSLSGAEITDCNLSGVAIADCNLTGMTINGIPVQDLLALHQTVKYWGIIKKAYTGFNERNIDQVFSVMHPDVHWPRAFEGGHVIGYDAVRAYWTKQWSEINPAVEPISITERPDGKVEVEVDQLVKGQDGSTLFEGKVRHIYVIENGLILSMDIEVPQKS